MKKIKVEFFHDTVCSYCFPMSATMRKIAESYKNIEIKHRSFALTWNEEDFLLDFESRQDAKEKVITYWKQVNKKFPDCEFNVEGMKKSDAPIPISKPSLIAAKAAGLIGGEGKYWDVFDNLQHYLFIESKNLEDEEVLAEAVKKAGVDVEEWRKFYHHKSTEEAVLADFEYVKAYGVNLVPTLIIEGKYWVQGTHSFEFIVEELEKIAELENKSLN